MIAKYHSHEQMPSRLKHLLGKGSTINTATSTVAERAAG
jgi:hypothetical protein